MCVGPEAFASQMRVLRAEFRPVSLAHLLASVAAGIDVRGMVAVTFDDGYRDVLQVALPELEAHEIPATVMVIAGMGGRTPWWDRLAAILSGTDPRLPFRVPMGRSEFVWPGVGGGEQLRIRLHRALRILPEEEREPAVARLRSVWDRGEVASLPTLLTGDEVRRLAASPLVRIGAHSLTHPPLAEVSPRRAVAEIRGARSRLAELTGRAPEIFSFPHGSHDASVRTWVREAGYVAALTSRQDSVRPGSDPFELPRLWSIDHGEPAFRRRLTRYAGRLTVRP